MSTRPRRDRFRTMLGIPTGLVLAALAVAALLGVQVSLALEASVSDTGRTVISGPDSPAGAGQAGSGVPVITETTVGTEVQRLVAAGAIQPTTSFDAARCLRAEGVTDSVLLMEEIVWISDETPAWLIVHGPIDRDTLRAAGGTVAASVVLPTCGTDEADPDEPQPWSGRVVVGSGV